MFSKDIRWTPFIVYDKNLYHTECSSSTRGGTIVAVDLTEGHVF